MPAFPLLALAATITAAAPDETQRNFGHWVSVCDNGLRFQVSSAMGQPANINVHLHVRREAGPEAAVEIAADTDGVWGPGPHSLLIDGQLFALVQREILLVVPAGSAMAAARALAQARSVQVVAGGERHPISAQGSAAALRDMDARQGRTGTVTAIVATGTRAASTMPAPPPPPVRTERIAPRDGPVIRPSARRVAEWRGAEDCDPRLDPADYPTQSWPLDARQAVILVPCHAGPHYGHALVMVGRRADGSDARPASFDVELSMSERSGPAVPTDNADRSETSGRLISGQRGAIAYPSTYEEWVWDGQRFRLIERIGSYGSYFRARVRRRRD
ncbi:DUF1176 domain-containing protein [Sphingosinicella terrae]|uniref:DUF1176 domain-containing protein n=1 Tax=Sphingosinicella terrae TaxID=2172047 RepID=UPI000E0D2894|nr:DUF1176 domain-containing protein [Sphingosinicella terrae]